MKEYWCWGLQRYLYLKKVWKGLYILEDIADETFTFTQEQFDKLEEQK